MSCVVRRSAWFVNRSNRTRYCRTTRVVRQSFKWDSPSFQNTLFSGSLDSLKLKYLHSSSYVAWNLADPESFLWINLKGRPGVSRWLRLRRPARSAGIQVSVLLAEILCSSGSVLGLEWDPEGSLGLMDLSATILLRSIIHYQQHMATINPQQDPLSKE